MATAIEPFNLLQLGIESVKGTGVPATRKIQCAANFMEEQDLYRSAYPQGVRATVGGAGTAVRKGTRCEVETELTAEEWLWPLLTGIRGGVVGVAGTSDYTYTFTPQLTTSVLTLDTATIEYVRADGTTNHYYGESYYGLTESFKLSWAYNQVAKLSWKMFARARQTGTVTASLSTYSSREPLVSNLLGVYLDTSWAGLGGTQLATIVRSADIEVMTGVAPDYTVDARADLDFTKHRVGSLGAQLSLTLELDATAASMFATYYRANAVAYIRLKNTGSTIGSAVKTARVDGAYRFTGAPQFSVDEEQVLMQADMEAVYDATGTKILEFTAINGLSAVD